MLFPRYNYTWDYTVDRLIDWTIVVAGLITSLYIFHDPIDSI